MQNLIRINGKFKYQFDYFRSDFYSLVSFQSVHHCATFHECYCINWWPRNMTWELRIDAVFVLWMLCGKNNNKSNKMAIFGMKDDVEKDGIVFGNSLFIQYKNFHLFTTFITVIICPPPPPLPHSLPSLHTLPFRPLSLYRSFDFLFNLL